MSNPAGSYLFSQLQQKELELSRLRQQATIALALEKEILSRAGLCSGMKLLDLGCGSGVISCELAKYIDPGEVTGIDFCEELLEVARSYYQTEDIKNVTFQKGDIYQLDFLKKQPFDFAYARFVFQHLSFPDKAINSIKHALKPGGTLCVVDIDDDWLRLYPEPASFASISKMAAVAQQDKGGDRYVGRKLSSYLQTAGFTDVRTNVHVLTNHDIGMRTLLDLVTGFTYELMPSERGKIAIQELNDIYSLLTVPYAWGGVAVFATTGRRS